MMQKTAQFARIMGYLTEKYFCPVNCLFSAVR